MGKSWQRAVDILGLQHQSGRCGSRASGCTSKESIVNDGRPTATLPVKDFIMANDCSIARMGSSTASSEKLRHKLANLSHGGNERSHRHRVRRNRLSRPPHRSASALSRISRSDRVKACGSGHSQLGPDDLQLQFLEANIQDERSVADALAGAYGVVNAVSLTSSTG
jgi:hypothetical protein